MPVPETPSSPSAEIARQTGKWCNQQAEQRHRRDSLDHIEHGEGRRLPARTSPQPYPQRQANEQARQQGAEQQKQMLAQGVVKYLLTVGILLQQRELIERPGSKQDDGQQPDLRIKQPAPQRPDGKMTDGLAGQQQTKRQRQPQAAAGRGARQRRAVPGELKRRLSAAPDKQREEQFGQQQVKKRRGPAWQPAKQHPGKDCRHLNAGEPGHHLPQPAPFAGE